MVSLQAEKGKIGQFMLTDMIKEMSVASAREIYEGSHIGNDLLLIDRVSDIPLPNEPRRMQCLLLALCTSGQARYTVDTMEHLVQAGDLIIISEGQVLDNYMLSRDCEGVGIILSYDFFREIIMGIHEMSQLFIFARNHPVCNLSEAEKQNIVSYFHVIKQKVDDRQHHFRRETVQSLMATMIYDLSNTIYRMQNMDGMRQTRAEKIFMDFIRLVEHNFRRERRVGWYGLQLGITPKYLSESVKAVSRRTPNEWIDNYVTMELRVQLRNSTKSIKQIAEELNFPNQSFLGKYFKEHVGLSPSDYRKGVK